MHGGETFGNFETTLESGGNDSTFLELFVGKSGLSAAVQRKCGLVSSLADAAPNEAARTTFDLRNPADFKCVKSLVKRRKVRWLHMTPPGKTFLRSYRKDRHRKVCKLRSFQFPGGLHPRSNLVRGANLLASRSAQLGALQMKANGWFSLKNPAASYIWQYQPVKRLSSNPKVKLIFAGCGMYLGKRVQSTGWLTNAPFLESLNSRPSSLAQDEFLAEQYMTALEQAPCRQNNAETLCNVGPDKEDWTSKKWLRKVEESQCVGGLRNPTRSLQLLPGWREVGSWLFWVLNDEMVKDETLISMVTDIGNPTPGDFSVQLQFMRCRIAHELGLKDTGPTTSSLWGTLFKKLVLLSQDPDTEVATWPDAGTPLGILNPILPGGVFPHLDETEVWAESERLNSLSEIRGADSNYISYKDNQEAADELFWEEVQQGFADWSHNRETLEARVGPLVPSAIGVVVKNKAGVRKLRLVHDLRRSLVNQHILTSERIVLPRMSDLVEDVSILLEQLQPGEEIKLLSLDFSNAFKQLAVRDNEKRFLSGTACNGWFYYNKVLFGVRTGPLVWARLASLVARCTQSLLPELRARLQVFVDDPIVALRGTSEQIEDMAAKILILWRIMGLEIAWKKGSLSHSTDWIGAKVTVDSCQRLVTVEVPADKIQEWKHLAASMTRKSTISKRELQKFTGKMQWAAGFAQQAKPFVRMLHAALHSKPGRLEQENAVYTRQIQPAMDWLNSFLNGFHHGLTWTTAALWRNACCLDFYVDASPWGGGAVRLVNGQPVETFALTWNKQDEQNLEAVIGQPGSQALWESYMMLRCLWNWMTPDLQGFVRIRGDAEGVLAAFLKRSAKSPLLNKVVKEVTLHLAINFRSLEALHVWSEDNTWADSISRLSDPNKTEVYPPELCALPRVIDSPQFWHHE